VDENASSNWIRPQINVVPAPGEARLVDENASNEWFRPQISTVALFAHKPRDLDAWREG